MSNPASMSVGAIVAVSGVILVLGASVAAFMSMIETGNEDSRAAWINDELKPAVSAACLSNKDMPRSGELIQRFDSDNMTVREVDRGGGSKSFRLLTKEDGRVEINAEVATGDTTCPYGPAAGCYSGCRDVKIVGSNVEEPGVKHFKVNAISIGEVEIEVS